MIVMAVKKTTKKTTKKVTATKSVKPSVKKAAKKVVKKASKSEPKKETKKVTKKITKKTTTKTTKKTITKKPTTKKVIKKVAIKKTATKKITKKAVRVLVAEPDYRINEELTLTKYDIGAHTAPNVYNKDPMQTEEPPHTYDINRVVILPIDPKFAFIYWEVRQDTIDSVVSAFGPGKLTLRVYDVTNIEFNGYNAHEWWDMDVHHRFGTWYLRHNKSDRNLMVDIGIRGNDGNFHAIYRSKAIYFPRDFMVGPGKILWMLVDEFGNKLISDIEDYTDADLELLKKIMGADRFKRFMKGGLDIFLGASAWGRIPIIDTYIDLESMPSSRSGSSAMPTSQGGNKK
jgi:uncharacterized protein